MSILRWKDRLWHLVVLKYSIEWVRLFSIRLVSLSQYWIYSSLEEYEEYRLFKIAMLYVFNELE
jgi:hypothetical protein